MSTEVIVYVLTALAAVVVLLTRVRLAGAEAAGRADVGTILPGAHTACGLLALACWVVFLVGGDALGEGASSLVGIVALGFWWLTVLVGLLILMRWLPSRGRHSAEARSDSWSEGPGLSVLAHGGLTVGVAVFTWVYLISAV